MRASPLVRSFGDDGVDPVFVPYFMNGYEASQFLQEQARAHCRIKRVRLKGSNIWWLTPRPNTWVEETIRAKLTTGIRRAEGTIRVKVTE